MKKFLKITAFVLALILSVSFIACDAANNKMEAAGDDGMFNEPSDGGISKDENNSSIAGDINGTVKPSETSLENAEDAVPEEPDMPDGSLDEELPDGDDATDSVGDKETEGEENNGAVEPPITNLSSLITTPFTNTSEYKFSTFSADVDTASYTYFRKLVGFGYTLEDLRHSSETFRTEEFINYFRYDEKAPGVDELFGVTTSLVSCPWDEQTLLFRATLQTETPITQAPNNLVFLIDVSGSMSSSDKLPLLKKAFSYLVSSLKPNDTVSIVTYSGREAVVLDGCTGSNPDAIMSAINSLTASGSTNGEAGLTMAYQIAEKHMKEGSNNRIIMASDGDLNVGISSAEQLTRYIEEKRASGIYLSVLGFGSGNYRDEKMEALADNGNGVYYYIDGESEAEKVFGTDLTGTLYTVANDVKLQIEFNSQRVESYRLIGYDNRILDKEDFEDDTKDAGEVGASHQVTVCYEIKLAEIEDMDAIIDAPLMTLRVRYKNPGEPMSRLNEYMISGIKTRMTDDVRFIASVIELVSLIRNPEYDGNITVESILAELMSLNLTDPAKIEFREIVKTLATK